MARNVYITTTLPYVNSDPHIGFALEIVQADTYARARKLSGDRVFFNTGTDEHGQKIYEKAIEVGKDPQAYVDEYAEKFKNLKELLGLSEDIHFIRTTDAHHVAAAQELWKRCDAAGDIYKKEFEGLYCVGCERFLAERDLVEGKCPLHPNLTPQVVKEENYFFRFSQYESRLREYVEQSGAIVPDARRAEALQFIEQGLPDFSISRKAERMSWGIPVPGDSAHVMYVWFDALTNYISTLGWPTEEGDFNDFWRDGETVQMAGKDQVRFQSLMWQAMLFSAGISPTDAIFYHGFVTSGGQKMSKSLGNVISPVDLVEEFGTDAVRYFLLRHMHPFEDSDFTRERFVEDYTANLANGLGNLTARIMKMAETNLPEPVVVPKQDNDDQLHKFFLAYDFNTACDFVWKKVAELDIRIQETQPFKLVKEDPAQGRGIIEELVLGLHSIGRMLAPIMPNTSEAIVAAVMANKKPETLFPRVE